MYCRWILFKLEIKRLMQLLLLILMETLLFAFIVSGIGVFASKAVYGDKSIGEMKVGIVVDEGDSLAKMLVKFVQSMDSLKDMAAFEILSEEAARAELENGEIYAAIIVPEGIVDSIMSGENLPATILLDNSYSQMETEVFAQLTRSGAKLLTVAQAGIYAADALCIENGMQDKIQQTEDYLNAAYLKYALRRGAVFRVKEVTAVKGVGLTDYYGISMLLAYLSFVGLSFGRYIQVRMGERQRMLSVRGVSPGVQYVIEAGAFASVFALLGMILSFLVYMLLGRITASSFHVAATWILLIPVWLAIGTFLRMLLQIMGNSPGGIGVCFVLLMIFMLVSGIFIPSAFLPVWVEKLGDSFFYKGWMETTAVILQGRSEGVILLKLLIQLIIFLLAGALIAAIKSRQKGTHSFKMVRSKWERHGEKHE